MIRLRNSVKVLGAVIPTNPIKNPSSTSSNKASTIPASFTDEYGMALYIVGPLLLIAGAFSLFGSKKKS